MESPRPARFRPIAVISILFTALLFVTALLVAASCLRSCWVTRLVLSVPWYHIVLGIPRHYSFSGPIEDGNNALGVHGRYERTIDFSPDGKVLAYIWSDAEFVYPPELGARPCTLTESMEIRVRRLDGDGPEFKIPLDSIDLRPDGITYFGLGVSLQTSPDSQQVAALCARRLVLVDALSGRHRTIEYEGEFFSSFAWMNANEIAFSTSDGEALTFWRYNLASPPAERVKVYTEPSRVIVRDNLPPDLRQDDWSPRGRFVSFVSCTPEGEVQQALLDLHTGAIRPFPLRSYCLTQCWKHDETAVLVADLISDEKRIVLVNPETMEIEDLTDDFRRTFGDQIHIAMVSPVWTPDDQFVILYRTIEYPPKNQFTGWRFEHKGYVIRPHPFQVVLQRDEILRWSPFPGWVLVQGGGTFEWLDLAGDKTAPISGWINDWTWSDNGRLAAKIGGGEVKVFRPEIPPEFE